MTLTEESAARSKCCDDNSKIFNRKARSEQREVEWGGGA